MSRRCAVDGCETLLSIYNPATRCWVHTERKPVKGDGIHMGRRQDRREDRGDDLTDAESRRYWDGKGRW